MSTSGGTRAIVAAMLANLGIAISKFVAYVFTGSSSMLAEGVHSVADTGNQLLLLWGGKRARRAADETHPFGYGRARYVYGFIVSEILFVLGGAFALYEGWHKIQHPEELTRPAWAFGVLGVAIVLESLSLRTAVKEANPHRHGSSWLQYVRRSRQPELPVVLLEDTGALLGLVFALSGVTMAVVTGDGRWDGVGSIAIGSLLLVIAMFLAFEMKSMLIGEGGTPDEVAAIRAALVDDAGRDRVIHLKTLYVGPDDLMVAAKVRMLGQETAPEIAAAIDEAERRIRARVPHATTIYLEPDLYSEAAAAAGPDSGSPAFGGPPPPDAGGAH